MSEYTYNEAAGDFKKFFDLAHSTRLPIKITNPEGHSVILLSEEDFEAMEETFYLMRNPYNAEHLLNSVNEKSFKYESIKELRNETGI